MCPENNNARAINWRTPARNLYYPLINIDEYYVKLDDAAGSIDAVLAAARPQDLPPPLQIPGSPGQLVHWRQAAKKWRSDVGIRTKERLGPLSPETARQVLLQCAPMGLIEGCALQYASAAVNSHTKAASELLRSYVSSSGTGDSTRRFGSTYADLLNVAWTSDAPRSHWELARNRTIADTMFAMPVIQLALSLFPCTRAPELLGVTLFNAAVGIHPLVEAAATSLGGGIETSCPAFIADAASRQEDAMGMAIAAAFAQFADADGASGANGEWHRVGRAFAAAVSLLQAELTTIQALLGAGAFDTRTRMIDLVGRKAPFAAGYHGRCPLAGKTIDEWFGQDDAGAFVDALAGSRFVRPGDPEHSALVMASAAARGPMAGIFRSGELAIITDWIRALPRTALPLMAAPRVGTPQAGAVPAAEGMVSGASPPAPTPAALSGSGSFSDRGANKFAELPTRDLYYHLLQVERFPEVLNFAKRYAALWLSRAARDLDKGPRSIPFVNYDHAALDEWLVQEHNRQTVSYAGQRGRAIPTREEMIESSVQLCPTVLVDGAWLQRFGNVALCRTAVGSRLFRIYLDEVGNGCSRENHPNIYRELMSEMGVNMPEFGSMEFCRWAGFKDGAFLVPTFWLCISQFPRRFLPELLGLTLAMELSGVGGTYRSASDALRHYGFSSTFVDLHNTVDNIVTGHTAMALDAIEAHLDEMQARGGLDEVQRHWRRVWTGYLALVPPAGYG